MDVKRNDDFDIDQLYEITESIEEDMLREISDSITTIRKKYIKKINKKLKEYDVDSVFEPCINFNCSSDISLIVKHDSKSSVYDHSSYFAILS